MRIQFSTAQQILFGEGVFQEAISQAAALGQPILIVAGRQRVGVERAISGLAGQGVQASLFEVTGEPDLETISAGVAQARSTLPAAILAIGGGSVLDTAKAISGLLANPGEVLDYLEVVGAGKPLLRPGPPLIAVPTTAGTGAEVTRNAVIGVPARRVKVSLRSPLLMPQLAAVDPELTYSMPPEVTASTGMDALTQLIEPFLSIRANPFSDLFCREGIARAGRSLAAAYRDGSQTDARHEMSYASLLGGLALANAGLGAVHGFAGVLGGMYRASHGAICARLLPVVIETNAAVIQARRTDADRLARFDEVARLATGRADATVGRLVKWLEELCAEMHIPRLRDLGVLEGDFEQIAAQASLASSMKANPVVLERDRLREILAQAW